MSYNTFSPIVKDGLVFYMDALNTKSYTNTNTAYDLTVNGNTGTLTNGVTYSSSAKSFVFDGVDDYIQMVDTTLLRSNYISVSTWVNGSVVSGIHMIWEHEEGTPYRGTLLAIISNGARFELYSNGLNETVYGPLDLTSNTWYNICGTYDGVNLRVYINGVLGGSIPKTGVIVWPVSTSVRIGRRSINATYHFNGKLGNLSIYNRGLSATEVLHNYNAQKNRFI